jgi:hypothetical protein
VLTASTLSVAPVASGVTRTPFPVSAFGANVFPLFELAFLIDQDLVATVLGETRTEAAALVKSDKARIDALLPVTPQQTRAS